MLEICDEVVVVCGRQEDVPMVNDKFGQFPVYTEFLHWEQPEWSYEELPKHLNLGVELCKNRKADWIIKHDMDYFLHEKDKRGIRDALSRAYGQGMMAVSFEKYQFHLAKSCYEKGKIPIALNIGKFPNICYGKAKGQYTDLCQPILHESDSIEFNGRTIEIPEGERIPQKKIVSSGTHVWNYDYTFKTFARSQELLYHFDRSHAKFWGAGYTGRQIEDITLATAMHDFLEMTVSRAKKKTAKLKDTREHPKHIKALIENIQPEQFGFSLWGNINKL